MGGSRANQTKVFPLLILGAVYGMLNDKQSEQMLKSAYAIATKHGSHPLCLLSTKQLIRTYSFIPLPTRPVPCGASFNTTDTPPTYPSSTPTPTLSYALTPTPPHPLLCPIPLSPTPVLFEQNGMITEAGAAQERAAVHAQFLAAQAAPRADVTLVVPLPAAAAASGSH